MAMEQGLVQACHDCSEGGLAVAAAEMAFAGGIGLALNLSALPRTADVQDEKTALYSESSARFLVEISPQDVEAFERTMAGAPCACIGTTGGKRLHIAGFDGTAAVDEDLDVLKAAWQGG